MTIGEGGGGIKWQPGISYREPKDEAWFSKYPMPPPAEIPVHRSHLSGNLHNNVFAHGTVTNDDDRRRPTTMCHDQRAWPIGPVQINTYQHLRGTS